MQENNTPQLDSVEHAIRLLAEWLISELRRSYSGKGITAHITPPATVSHNSSQRLFNINELAKYLSIPKGSIYTGICLRKIPENVIVRFGRSVRFDINAVNAWIEKNRSKN